MGFDKCRIMCIQHYIVVIIHITQKSFVAQNILICPLLPLSRGPGNHWSFKCLHTFAFSRTSHSCIQYFVFNVSLIPYSKFVPNVHIQLIQMCNILLGILLHFNILVTIYNSLFHKLILLDLRDSWNHQGSITFIYWVKHMG